VKNAGAEIPAVYGPVRRYSLSRMSVVPTPRAKARAVVARVDAPACAAERYVRAAHQ
jgi:hypothetical protein